MSYDQINNAFRIVGLICILMGLYIITPIVFEVLREATQDWKKIFRGKP